MLPSEERAESGFVLAPDHDLAVAFGAPEPALAWRKRWDAELAAFKQQPGVGRTVARSTEFITPLRSDRFMWDVY